MTEVQVKSSKSSEASKYGVQDMGVVIGGKIKLSASFEEKELEDVIKQAKDKISEEQPLH